MRVDTSELRRLLEAATPGEWENWPEIGATFGPDGEAIQTCGTGFHGERAEEFKANAAIIPAMRNALPALLDRLDVLEDVAEALRGAKAVMGAGETARSEWLRRAISVVDAALARLDGEGER